MPEFRYHLHGLELSVEQALPTLTPCGRDGKPDAQVFIQVSEPWAAIGPSPEVELLGRVEYSDGGLLRSLERITRSTERWLVQRFNLELALAFTEDGKEVHIFGGLVRDLDYVATCIAGPVASFLRWLRGWPSLHASSVVVDGSVLAVAGPSGAGKSTTVAALASLGHGMFSDEVLGWRVAGGRVLASPGPARLKLLPDALAALGRDAELLPKVRSDLDKRLLQLPEAGTDADLPLKTVYLLDVEGDAGSKRIRELRGAEAFIALKANCRDDAVLMPAMRERQFEALAELARKVRICKVPAHGGLAQLREFAGELVEDFRRAPAGDS
jgi:hypothetical protein